ncbi:MAG TPA: tyrosine-type recombinase/integrase, partial [Ktedonobacteraceae bacterium]|nr:tyrosine-type recombinase/integrase [Ktedonobacteraceae bacterium]
MWSKTTNALETTLYGQRRTGEKKTNEEDFREAMHWRRPPFHQEEFPKHHIANPGWWKADPLFAYLKLEACQSCKQDSQRGQGMDVRNRALLWLLWETGLSVSDLCRLRLSEVNIHTGVVTVRRAGRVRRIFPLSVMAKEAMRAYVEEVRMTLTWTPGRSEDPEILLLTGNRTPLTRNTVTQVFA